MVVSIEPVSLTVGVVALASLFSTCLECFGYFEAAKLLHTDFEILLVKLDCQKERLLTWGDLVGIGKPADEGRHPDLDQKQDLVQRCLKSLESLFSNTEKLQKDYGVHPSDSNVPENRIDRLGSDRMQRFRTVFRRLILSAPSSSTNQTIIKKTRWAIHDKAKFETLLVHIQDIISNLHQVFPVLRKSQQKMVNKDIASLNLLNLRLIQDACDGTDEYQGWSDIASAVIMASEKGTVDHRHVGEWIEDGKEIHISERQKNAVQMALKPPPPPSPAPPLTAFQIKDLGSTQLYFVFTPSCKSDPETRCGEGPIGPTSLTSKGVSFLPEHDKVNSWTLGKRITKSMNVTFSEDDVEMLRRWDFELSELQSIALEAEMPIGTVYIYCSPCACAIRTAMAVCRAEDRKLLRYLVRVDDRISSSCCPEIDKMNRLGSLVSTMKWIEATSHPTPEYLPGRLSLIDRVWIERRLYQMEEEAYVLSDPKPMFDRAAELMAGLQKESKTTGVVILGELEYCLWMLQTSPFPWKPRLPRETEIYKLACGDHRWTRHFLGTFTPKLLYLQKTYDLPSTGNTSKLPTPKGRSPPPKAKEGEQAKNFGQEQDEPKTDTKPNKTVTAIISTNDLAKEVDSSESES